MVKVVTCAANIIKNCNQNDLCIQNELLEALISYKNKILQFQNDNLMLKQALHNVLERDLYAIMAPRKPEKYCLNQN